MKYIPIIWLGAAGVFGFGWDDMIAGTFFNGIDMRWKQAGSGAGIGAIIGLIGGLYSATIEGVLLFPLCGAFIGAAIGFCVNPKDYEYESKNIGWAMFSLGVWATGIIIGFLPVLWPETEGAKTARLDDIRNWTVSFVPSGDGRFMGHIGFIAHL